MFPVKNQTGKDCAELIHLNSSAGQLEKDQAVLGTGNGAVAGGAIGQLDAGKDGANGSRNTGVLDKNGSS